MSFLQREQVTDTMDSARRWRGLVCPDCRFVFRVPKDHGGSGVVCPSCRRLLRIPGPEDELPPLVAAVEEVVDMQVVKSEWKERRKREKILAETPWEDEFAQTRRVKQARALRMGWQLAAGMVLLAGLVVWLSMTMQHEPVVAGPAIQDDVAALVDELETAQPEAPELWFDNKAVQEFCRTYFQASTVDELLPLVRDAARLEPEIRRYYAEERVGPVEIVSLGVAEEVEMEGGKVVKLLVQGATYQWRNLFLFQTADGWKVDWESWVGHSSMPWAVILDKKPTEPVLVRAVLSPVEYYNMDFSDDQKWSSCRITSPDGEHILYGYLLRASDERRELFRVLAHGSAVGSMVSVRIRFPEGANSSNQVIVDRMVAGSWLIPEMKP